MVGLLLSNGKVLTFHSNDESGNPPRALVVDSWVMGGDGLVAELAGGSVVHLPLTSFRCITSLELFRSSKTCGNLLVPRERVPEYLDRCPHVRLIVDGTPFTFILQVGGGEPGLEDFAGVPLATSIDAVLCDNMAVSVTRGGRVRHFGARLTPGPRDPAIRRMPLFTLTVPMDGLNGVAVACEKDKRRYLLFTPYTVEALTDQYIPRAFRGHIGIWVDVDASPDEFYSKYWAARRAGSLVLRGEIACHTGRDE